MTAQQLFSYHCGLHREVDRGHDPFLVSTEWQSDKDSAAQKSDCSEYLQVSIDLCPLISRRHLFGQCVVCLILNIAEDTGYVAGKVSPYRQVRGPTYVPYTCYFSVKMVLDQLREGQNFVWVAVDLAMETDG